MNLSSKSALLLALLIALSASAQETQPDKKSLVQPEKEKASYALGMNLAFQRKRTDADIDINAFTEAIQDVLEGKPTRVKESEVPDLLNQARVNRLGGQADT